MTADTRRASRATRRDAHSLPYFPFPLGPHTVRAGRGCLLPAVAEAVFAHSPDPLTGGHLSPTPPPNHHARPVTDGRPAVKPVVGTPFVFRCPTAANQLSDVYLRLYVSVLRDFLTWHSNSVLIVKIAKLKFVWICPCWRPWAQKGQNVVSMSVCHAGEEFFFKFNHSFGKKIDFTIF